MIVYLLAYLGGVLTIVSPCILPVLPFVFARTGRPFLTGGLPMLVGMAAMFAVVATLAAVGGGWAVQANQYGRWLALVLLALFGLAMLFPALADRATAPLVGLGARLSQRAAGEGSGFWASLLLGIATGLLWAPCAGPILGLVLTGAALNGANATTTLLLAAYGAGAATSLGLALLVGGRLFAAMKRSLGVGHWLRRGLGGAVLVAVAAIALGLDTGVLARLSLAGTTRVEQALLQRFKVGQGDVGQPDGARAPRAQLEAGAPMPELTGAVRWLNSPPLTREGLRGKVVLVDFWTYSCINCLRALPYVHAWADKYGKRGLVVIGVHTPEFAFEKDIGNVTRAMRDLRIGYPVAIDNDFAIWRSFGNRHWPAHYLIDATGRIRHVQVGEGDYDRTEREIQALLAEAGAAEVPRGIVEVAATGAQAGSAWDTKSPETYVGYLKAKRFVSPGGIRRDRAADYAVRPSTPKDWGLNDWGLAGTWTVGPEHASLARAGGRIVYRFHARDLHLVLGPGAEGRPVRFRVTLDGRAPGEAHGADVDAAGVGTVTGQRLYQLIRQPLPARERTFEIEFLDPGVEAFAFTFG